MNAAKVHQAASNRSAENFGPNLALLVILGTCLISMVMSLTGNPISSLAQLIQITGLVMMMSTLALGCLLEPVRTTDPSMSFEERIDYNMTAQRRFIMTIIFHTISGMIPFVIGAIITLNP